MAPFGDSTSHRRRSLCSCCGTQRRLEASSGTAGSADGSSSADGCSGLCPPLQGSRGSEPVPGLSPGPHLGGLTGHFTPGTWAAALLLCSASQQHGAPCLKAPSRRGPSLLPRFPLAAARTLPPFAASFCCKSMKRKSKKPRSHIPIRSGWTLRIPAALPQPPEHRCIPPARGWMCPGPVAADGIRCRIGTEAAASPHWQELLPNKLVMLAAACS